MKNTKFDKDTGMIYLSDSTGIMRCSIFDCKRPLGPYKMQLLFIYFLIFPKYIPCWHIMWTIGRGVHWMVLLYFLPRGFTNYRDSKLTRILQNSLGGNATTVIFCTITPVTLNETLSPLQVSVTWRLLSCIPLDLCPDLLMFRMCMHIHNTYVLMLLTPSMHACM